MDNLTLTVIVPCYNVSAWLNRCVKSIVNQKYKDLDILLIDDGSMDNTATLCNELCRSDKRIRVIHQKNIGSSATRSKGISHTNTEFVTFVDADDWIHPDMYYNMMNAVLKENADIAQCGVCDISEDGEEKHRYQDFYDNSYNKYGHLESFSKLIEEKEWRSYMVNKIYRKSLFSNVVFPIGRGLDDDTSVMHQIFHNAKCSIYFKDEYYYYNFNPNSITKVYDLNSTTKKIFDRVNARLERYQFVAQYSEYKNLMPSLKSRTISVTITGLRMVIKYPSYFPKGFYQELSTKILSIPITKTEIDKELLSEMKWIEFQYLRFSPLLYRYTIQLFEMVLRKIYEEINHRKNPKKVP